MQSINYMITLVPIEQREIGQEKDVIQFDSIFFFVHVHAHSINIKHVTPINMMIERALADENEEEEEEEGEKKRCAKDFNQIKIEFTTATELHSIHSIFDFSKQTTLSGSCKQIVMQRFIIYFICYLLKHMLSPIIKSNDKMP